ncbi:hypothetical protein BB559_002514 [Furculomyces boomerangus]|uniref:RNA polymerase II transcription factor B subunit 5 n=1 Tax=Furculomyces boomerangus TaxID=61424 RepID=A0A2T9YUR1_9FUNG|nr:hypothetical protein BB559_002514 [Furculomyces boomerangus]
MSINNSRSSPNNSDQDSKPSLTSQTQTLSSTQNIIAQTPSKRKLPSDSPISTADSLTPISKSSQQHLSSTSLSTKRPKIEIQPLSSEMIPENSTSSLPSSSKSHPIPSPKTLPPKYKEEEIVRIILQQLSDLGYTSTLQKLQEESNHKLESEIVTEFRTGIIEGDWRNAELCLNKMNIKSKHKHQSILFYIKKQQYLEALSSGKYKTAIKILQNELSTLNFHHKSLHQLTRLMLCTTTAEITEHIGWLGNIKDSRQALLDSLHEFIPSDIMLAPHRLQTLFDQALEYQKSSCIYHVSDGKNTLYFDHTCKHKPQFSEKPSKIMFSHDDEVWFVVFSNNGKYLASGSKDSTIIIWETENFDKYLTLKGHNNAISCLSWSSDDSKLLSASNDMIIRIWDIKTGACLKEIDKHTEFVTAAQWLPDGKSFVSGGLDKQLLLWSSDGQLLKQWISPRVHDLKVSSDGKTVVVADNENSIHIYNFVSLEPIKILKETSNVLSIFLASDCEHLLVGTQNNQLHMWNLLTSSVVQSYDGYKQGSFVTRCGLGGVNESVVYCGSADGNIHLWSRNSGMTIQVLEGHVSNVNCCSFYYYNNKHQVLATAGDDHSIRIWEQPQATNDPTAKQILLVLNEKKNFIIEDLDETHVFVESSAVQMIKSALDSVLDENTYKVDITIT